MPIAYDSALVEKAVFLATRTDAPLERRLHQVIDPLYEIADAEARHQRFAEAYRAFFAKLGLDRLMAKLIDERPLINRHVDSCVVREADQRKEESAELLVQEQRRAVHALPGGHALVQHHTRDCGLGGEPMPRAVECRPKTRRPPQGAADTTPSPSYRGFIREDTCDPRLADTATPDSAPSADSQEPPTPMRTLVLQVCPESLVESGPFALKMRRELLHVSDMIDARFGYDRSSLARLGVPQHVVRDRYRVLWDVYVEGRLVREGHSDLRDEGPLKHGFARVFADCVSQLGSAPYGQVFDAEQLSHATLLEWAHNPDKLFAPTRNDDDSPCAACKPHSLPHP